MQEHIYKASIRKIASQSFFIWLFVFLQLYINVDGANTFIERSDQWPLVFINLTLAAINVPAVILFLNYYRNSKDKEFVVTYDKLKLRDVRTRDMIELKSTEIVKVKLVENARMSRLPWSFHEYFKFIDSNGKEIVVTSYIMDISEFWTDSLSRRLSSIILERERKYYPLI